MKLAPVNFKSLAYTLDVEGYSSAPVLARCGLPALDGIDEDGDWMPVALFDEMMAAVIDATGDPCFGLVAGKSLALARYGMFTSLVLHSANLRQILADLHVFSRVVIESCELVLDETPRGGARIVLQPVVAEGRSGRFRTDFVATSAVQMLRFVGAAAHEIHEVAFPYPCPAGHEERYATAFGPTVRFDRGHCAVSFAPQLLDRPLPSHDAVGYLMARTRVESALAALQARSDAAEKVRQFLLRAFPRQPALDETAQALGTTPRTLRRQLAQLGCSHSTLAQECQAMLAARLLAERRLSLKQIADALGFSSVSSFHRAFRRWHGSTPLQWRDGA